jgi:hypothetical protein
MSVRLRFLLLPFALFTAISHSRSSAAAIFTPVAISGFDAPGIPGALINSPGIPRLNNAGQVALTPTLKANTTLGITSNNDAVLYVGTPGALGIVVREAGAAPTFPSGVNFITRSNPAASGFSDDGRVVFPLSLAANAGAGVTTANDSLTWIGSPGNVTPLLREGDPATGIAGFNIDTMNVSQIFLTDNGKIYQRQSLTSGGVFAGNALYGGTTPANLTPLMRTGAQTPDVPAGALLNQFSTIVPNGNQLLVQGILTVGQGGVTADNSNAIWVTNGSGDLKVAIRSGDTVGGSPVLVDPGTQIASFGEVGMNRSGTVLVTGGKLVTDGVHASSSNDNTLLVGSLGGSLSVIAREGTPAPGLASVSYGSSFSEGRIANNGDILLLSNLAGAGVTTANDAAFFKGSSSNLQLLLREGDQAPGFPAGTKIQEWGTSDFLIDNGGMFALIDTVSDGTNSTKAIFVTDPVSGQLELLIKAGDSLQVAPGDSRVVSDLTVAFGPSGQSSNESHQLSFIATFADGTNGSFIASVPEPASITMLIGAIAVTLGVRARMKTRT